MLFSQVTEEPLLPQTLCDSCAKSITNSYLFKKFCEYSNEKWGQAMSTLENSLTQADTLAPPVRSVYLMISATENCIFTSRKTHSMDKLTVVSKVQHFVKRRNKYVKDKTLYSYICEECGVKVKSKTLLAKHMKMHSTSPQHCSQCFKVFSTPLQLTEHEERVHYPKKIQCSKCAKRFSTEKMLRTHNRLEHVAALCKLCFVQFPSKTALKAHLDKHDVLKCPQCEKTFVNKQTYRIHCKQCGSNEERVASFFCDICGKGYIRKNGVRTHLKTDHGFGKVLSCSWCSKKFDAISRLKNHIVKHTRERNFTCEQCNGKFVTQAALVYHTRLHTGEKPFKCDLCNESFLSTSRRMEHKRRKHFGPTQQCHICSMKFITGSQLRKHIERHSDPHSKLYIPVREENSAFTDIIL